ncbi:hypothetical protein BH09PAT3_BH09PAT3_4140 [soil metagenome]
MTIARQLSYKYGAWLWVISIQYYILQLVVASQWSNGYSWAHNTISDLANTHCGPYGDRLVCSPLHAAMNGSFLLLGLTMIAGSVLLGKKYAVSLLTRIGFGCMVLAGIGTILVGLFPENTVSSMHVIGAALPFIFGNIGMILLGLTIRALPKVLAVVTVLSGVIALVALPFFVSGTTLGIGSGWVERIVAYPQSIWMIVFGLFILRTRDA